MNAPLDQFVSHVIKIGALRGRDPDWPLYERLKADLTRDHPGLTQREYERAILAIARAAGV
jgi:hypothetical protein